MSDEFAEVDRVVGFGEIVVVERAIGNLRDPFELGAKQRIGLVLRRAGFRERGGKLARPGEPRPRAVDAVDMHAQYLPNCPPYVTAGVDVIADEHDAVRPQPTSCKGEHRVAHSRRNPGVDAVGDHVVELTQRFRELARVSLYESDIGDRQLGCSLPRGGDGARREIATDELRIGQACRHRQQIGSVVTAELEDAAGRDVRRRETEQCGDDRHVIGMRERVRLRFVRDGVVLLGQRRAGRPIVQAHRRTYRLPARWSGPKAPGNSSLSVYRRSALASSVQQTISASRPNS